MSHAHRDETEKVEDQGQASIEETVAAPAARAISNAEAERRAKEQRDADGVESDVATERKFLGDADGTEGGGPRVPTIDELEQRALAHAAARTHRGPPAPRHAEVGDEVSWIAQGQLGDFAYIEDGRGASWIGAERTPDGSWPGGVGASTWIRGGS